MNWIYFIVLTWPCFYNKNTENKKSEILSFKRLQGLSGMLTKTKKHKLLIMAAVTLQVLPLPTSPLSHQVTLHRVTLPSQILLLRVSLTRRALPTPVFVPGVLCASCRALTPLPCSSAKLPMVPFYKTAFLNYHLITLFISIIKSLIIYIHPTYLCA